MYYVNSKFQTYILDHGYIIVLVGTWTTLLQVHTRTENKMTKSTTNKHCLVKKSINATHAIICWRDGTPSLSCFVLSNLLTSSVKSRCRFIKMEGGPKNRRGELSFVD